MKKSILIILTMLLIIAAGVFGIVKRRTYTNIIQEDNYMDKLQVAEIPGDIAIEVCKNMKKTLPNLSIILKVRFLDEVEYLFGTSRQKICVQKVYAGEDIEVGDEFYISADLKIIMEEELSAAELGFVNLPRQDYDYLVFLSEKIDTWDESIPVYSIYDETPIVPMFCYEEFENVIYPVNEENTYVPYSEVKENEFFTTTEEGMEAWGNLKDYLLSLYL